MKRSQKISAQIILFAILASIFMTLFQNCGGSVTLQSAPKPPPTLPPPPETQSTATIINVTSSTPNGIYNQGAVISIQVIFSEAVFVTGTPTLTLNTTPSKTATYVSGSETTSLTFSYTVGATDTSADLDYLSTTALSLNGGTIKNNKERAAELTLASPGDASSLGANKDIIIQLNIPSVNLAAGYSHNCAIVNGSVKCWGANFAGSLGNNSATRSLVPINVQGLTSEAKTITAGNAYTCALTTGGGVKCWGHNGFGQLGNNSYTDSVAPIDVQGLTSGVLTITAGSNSIHACALTTSGGVKCWGWNNYGQLGNNSTANSAVPVDVYGLTSGVKAIRSDGYHTCALTTGGSVKCWGQNAFGQLGNNSTADSLVPVNVQGLTSGVQTITVGTIHACALTTSGGVKCWGHNAFGQLGNNSTADSLVPVNVQGLTSGVRTIAAGAYHTCAAMTSGEVKCWGYNVYGQLGDNSTTEKSLVPVNVQGLASSAQITTGTFHACALMTNGAVKCWGRNNDGQLGNNSTTDSRVPVNVIGIP